MLDHHPFDVVGWDGHYYPWAFSIHDFEPRVGRVHLPPPVHQTFEGDGFVVCSFCPRPYDFDPQAVPVPYNHSNVMSDEVLYYASSEFMSRKGIEYGSITLHPDGIPHGPHPGRTEQSLGQSETNELAVMLDTFRPLRVSSAALDIEDREYYRSWIEARPRVSATAPPAPRGLFEGLIDYAGLFPPASLALPSVARPVRLRTARGPSAGCWAGSSSPCDSSRSSSPAARGAMAQRQTPGRIAALGGRTRPTTCGVSRASTRSGTPSRTWMRSRPRSRRPSTSASSRPSVRRACASCAKSRRPPASGRSSTSSPRWAPSRSFAPVASWPRRFRPRGTSRASCSRRLDAGCPSRPRPAFITRCAASTGSRTSLAPRVALMHGFLNLLCGAAWVHARALPAPEGPGVPDLDIPDAVLALLERREAPEGRADGPRMRWGDDAFEAAALIDARSSSVIAIGSCSFEEPVAELQRLGLL